MKKLSATMAAAFVEISDRGGVFLRHAGGYWTYPGCPLSSGKPDWHYGTPTIDALVKRGMLTYSHWIAGRSGAFPVAAKVVPLPEVLP